MKALEKRILNALLDSYENSKLSRGENKVAVHISYAFRPKNIPEYFDESSMECEEIHTMISQLQDRGFLTIIWKKNKVGHIIDKVILCEKTISDVYQYLHRIPKTDIEKTVLRQFDHMLETELGVVSRAFILRMYKRVEEGKSVKEYMDISDSTKTDELIYALNQTEHNQTDCFVREFSIRIFHDSKKYASLIPRICRIIGEERLEYEGMEKEEILSEYQIYYNPSYVYFKGAARLKMKSQLVDVSVFEEGVGFALNNRNLEDIQFQQSSTVQFVYTIENLTTFFRFQKKNSLIIYLGGYHNHVRRELLKKIYKVFPQARYYHFGDIDAGGFQIYYHLKDKTSIPFTMCGMDLQTLIQYEEYGKRLTENDRNRLRNLRDKVREGNVIECIDYMLKHNVKLEQECIDM